MLFESTAYISPAQPVSLVASRQASGLDCGRKRTVNKRELILLPVAATGMLTLSGEPVYSILCDSPTQLPPSAKTAFCMELDFNNLSSEDSSEMQSEGGRASGRLGRLLLLPRHPGDLTRPHVEWHPSPHMNAIRPNASLHRQTRGRKMGDWYTLTWRKCSGVDNAG